MWSLTAVPRRVFYSQLFDSCVSTIADHIVLYVKPPVSMKILLESEMVEKTNKLLSLLKC